MIKRVRGFPDYLVTEEGNIFSLKPTTGGGNILKQPKPIKKFLNGKQNHDYYVVGLSLNGKVYRKKVAVVVLETFVSPRPSGMLACHGEKGRLVDSLDNVYWGTPKRNMEDKKRDGTWQGGENSPHHTLNELQVRIIRKSYSFRGKCGLTIKQLSQVFGVHESMISCINLRKNWKHI